jgi:hypothetical protein
MSLTWYNIGTKRGLSDVIAAPLVSERLVADLHTVLHQRKPSSV